MRLPGTRYQEHGWEHVRKLLGRCSLQAFAQSGVARLLDPAGEGEQLALYVDLVAEALHDGARGGRAESPGNSYGDSVAELALSLLYELQARPADWSAFRAAVAAEYARAGRFWESAGADAILRKKVNDMFAVLRDKVDADNYQAACGRVCSANKIYTYRMLDMAYGEIARLFSQWQQHKAQVGAILGREVDAMPIEVRQLVSIGQCKPEWVIGWSASLAQFADSAGPLHTRSKRFASLKNNPARIAEMMTEIGDYEELSSNRDQDWLHDALDAADWVEDLWRVLDAPVNDGPDQLLAPPEDAFAADGVDLPETPIDEGSQAEREVAASLSLPPRFMQLARGAQEAGSWSVRLLAQDSMPVRLAVYLKLLGSADDTYPAEWLDPATGELPTMAQLAALDQVSLPTLRKRRDAAIDRLTAAAAERCGATKG
jgi:hypothetical protein